MLGMDLKPAPKTHVFKRDLTSNSKYVNHSRLVFSTSRAGGGGGDLYDHFMSKGIFRFDDEQ